MTGFIDVIDRSNKTDKLIVSKEILFDNEFDNIPEIKIPKNALYALYYIAGYLIMNIAKNEKVCEKCISSCGSKSPSDNVYAEYSKLKRYNSEKECLFFVNDSTFKFFEAMENIFEFIFKQCVAKAGRSEHITSLFEKKCTSFLSFFQCAIILNTN